MEKKERGLVYLNIIYESVCICEGNKDVFKLAIKFPMPELISDGGCFICGKECEIKISKPIRFYVLEEGRQFTQEELKTRKVSEKTPYKHVIQAYIDNIKTTKTCERCDSFLELCPGNEPWSEEHWSCPSCDSTYVKEHSENIGDLQK